MLPYRQNNLFKEKEGNAWATRMEEEADRKKIKLPQRKIPPILYFSNFGTDFNNQNYIFILFYLSVFTR
jgi:hypothetical protein